MVSNAKYKGVTTSFPISRQSRTRLWRISRQAQKITRDSLVNRIISLSFVIAVGFNLKFTVQPAFFRVSYCDAKSSGLHATARYRNPN